MMKNVVVPGNPNPDVVDKSLSLWCSPRDIAECVGTEVDVKQQMRQERCFEMENRMWDVWRVMPENLRLL